MKLGKTQDEIILPEIWTKLDKAKLGLEILSLLMTTLLTIALFIYGNKLSNSQWTNQKLVEKRIMLYDDMMPLLNDILCYHNLYGNYKELSPLEIISRKRELDKIFYTQSAFFSENFKNEYEKFMNLCFKTYSGNHKDAQIRSTAKLYESAYTNFHKTMRKDTLKWVDSWKGNYTNEMSMAHEIEVSYYRMIALLGKDIGIEQ